MSPTEPLKQANAADWPRLPSGQWGDTVETLHMWTQIVGKVRMDLSPWVNHSWSVPLYLNACGFTTSTIPYGARTFEIDFDFVDHVLPIRASDGQTNVLALQPKSVAQFYHELLETLSEMGLDISIHTVPNEIPDPIAFPEDEVHRTYDSEHAHSLWSALVQADRVMKAFRARFTGKVSPVHFFWGSFDLAVTRFSGREAPTHPGGVPGLPDEITREAYSHEVTSCGFWPGNREAPDPIFYAYAYPTPEGFSESSVKPAAAFWLEDLGEFALPYEVVRTSDAPDATLDAFFESTHAAAADLARWDREHLEWERDFRPVLRHRP